MFVVGIVGVGLLLTGSRRFYFWFVNPNVRAEARYLSWVYAVTGLAAWYAGGTGLLGLAIGVESLAVLNSLSILLCITFATLAWMARALLERIRLAGAVNTPSYILMKSRKALKTASLGLKQAGQIIAPTGWSEINLNFDSLDRVFSYRMFFAYFMMALAAVPVLLAVLLTYAIRSGSLAEQRIISVMVGYNTLLVVSCLTAATMACLAVLIILKLSRILLVRLNYWTVFKVVAAGTGYGTAAGVVTAALLPVLNGVLPLSASTEPTSDVLSIINPQLLLDVSAAGAVIGYGISLVVSLFIVCGSATNLFIKRFFGPLLFVLFVSLFSSMGANPQELMGRLVRNSNVTIEIDEVNCSVEYNVDALEQNSFDTSWLFAVAEACDSSFMITGEAFTTGVIIIVVGISLVWVATDFRKALTIVGE
jgi:hypothetical protein